MDLLTGMAAVGPVGGLTGVAAVQAVRVERRGCCSGKESRDLGSARQQQCNLDRDASTIQASRSAICLTLVFWGSTYAVAHIQLGKVEDLKAKVYVNGTLGDLLHRVCALRS
jgi:hypothetical protein